MTAGMAGRISAEVAREDAEDAGTVNAPDALKDRELRGSYNPFTSLVMPSRKCATLKFNRYPSLK